MKLTRNFDSTEFACPCRQCNGNITMDFAHKMQSLRDACGFKLDISSGYRCAEHNKSPSVKGALDSRHLYGDACDILIVNLTGEQRLKLIVSAYELGFTGFGFGATFLHVDTKPGKIRTWTY